MYWEEHLETLPREAIEKIQFQRLKRLLCYVYENVPFYRQKFDEYGIKPEEFKEIEDIKKFPFTHKDDLRNSYPYNMFAVPLKKIVRIHASSGTTGQVTVVGYTKNDIEVWSNLMARTLVSCGVTEDDIVQNAYGYGLFTGGLGFHYGAEKIGATVIPMSGGNTKRQVRVMKDFKTTVLTCTPSYSLYLAEVAEEEGIDVEELNLRVGIFGAEPWSEEMRKEIEEKLHLRAHDIYGLSEVMGPGVAVECEERNGLHIFEDHFFVELINPQTGEYVKEGEVGELVITTLTKEGIPVIRYRTKDLVSLNYEPCPCGRHFVRMSKVLGRSDDMLIIRGVNVFPSQIEEILMNIEGTEPHYMIVVDRKDYLDVLEVHVEVNEKLFSDEMKKLQELERKIKEEIQSNLGISASVKLVEPKTLERFEGKAKRVIDKRKI
ncbi:MAG: phenylacetate--CoA ligase [Actinobacteria bacterium]|nr:phenylacetate--CoA ligase [Actinomycetota bacterium]